MSYHWIQDRIAQGQFKTTWAKGQWNLADFFSKIHPVNHFNAMKAKFIVKQTTSEHTAKVPSHTATIKQVHFKLSPQIA